MTVKLDVDLAAEQVLARLRAEVEEAQAAACVGSVHRLVPLVVGVPSVGAVAEVRLVVDRCAERRPRVEPGPAASVTGPVSVTVLHQQRARLCLAAIRTRQ